MRLLSAADVSQPRIAREGWAFLGISFFVAVISWFFFSVGACVFFGLVTIFIAQFFRDPIRHVPAMENRRTVVLSPADGRVVSVGEAFDPYANRSALKISVFMSVFDVHSNRIPADGRVESVTYFSGRFLSANVDKSSELNERNAILIRTDLGGVVTCVQVAGLIARRVLCYVAPKDRVSLGDRFGFIRFGSRVDVYLPKEMVPVVCAGDKVRSAETLLARFPI